MGAWSLSGEPVFRDTARRLGDAMLPAFSTPSGMPANAVDVGTGKHPTPSNSSSVVLAEAGTLQLEFGALSAATGDSKYIAAADRSENFVLAASGDTGLVPTHLNPQGVFSGALSMGAEGDSYYEYLLKRWLQTGKKQDGLKDKWRQAMKEMQARLLRKTRGGLAFLTKLNGGSDAHMMEHLTCFAGGMLMLGSRSLPPQEVDPSWEPLAAELTETCYQMYRRSATGLAPDFVQFDMEAPAGQDMKIPAGSANMLRPEVVESLFYMHYYTGDPKYRRMAYDIFSAFQKHSKTAHGYARVDDVREIPVRLADEQPTWWFAETLKYLYLTFSPRETLDLERWVLNTEAHPMKIGS